MSFSVFEIPIGNRQSAITHSFGVGRGATGRLFSLPGGREFEFRGSLRFTLLRGVALTLLPAFAFGRFVLTGLFVLPFAFLLLFAFSFGFLFLGLFGLFSLLVFAAELVLRFSVDSSGVTLSGVSPSLVARLMSMATVCPALTTSPGRGNWNKTVSGFD
jgi:hypothetical protein